MRQHRVPPSGVTCALHIKSAPFGRPLGQRSGLATRLYRPLTPILAIVGERVSLHSAWDRARFSFEKHIRAPIIVSEAKQSDNIQYVTEDI